MKSILLTTAAALGFSALAAQAQMTDPEETTPRRAETAMSMRADRADFGGDGYTSTDGEVLYGTLCAGCHMPDGRGAVGAGFYPALAGNENVEYSGYAIYIIVNGQGGMPSLGHFLDDEQVVAVTSYIQSELGNGYEPDATVEDVEYSRPVDPADQNTKEHE